MPLQRILVEAHSHPIVLYWTPYVIFIVEYVYLICLFPISKLSTFLTGGFFWTSLTLSNRSTDWTTNVIYNFLSQYHSYDVGFWKSRVHVVSFPGGTSSKESACHCRRHKRDGFDPLVRKDTLEEGMTAHSSTLAWRIPMNRGAWWVPLHRAAKSQMWLKRLSRHSYPRDTQPSLWESEKASYRTRALS